MAKFCAYLKYSHILLAKICSFNYSVYICIEIVIDKSHFDYFFLYARHLTDVLWYGAVRPSVRMSVRPSVGSVVHNPCGQDIARTL